ncbi:hypothetical protein L915_08261, partial [Phytophthora nicotianae]
KMAASTQLAFAQLKDPESCLAGITAHAIQVIVNECSLLLEAAVQEHTVLRAYAGAPCTSHGTDGNLLSRMKFDFPSLILPAEEISEKVYPDSEVCDTECAYALTDLYLRSHGPTITTTPLKVLL